RFSNLARRCPSPRSQNRDRGHPGGDQIRGLIRRGRRDLGTQIEIAEIYRGGNRPMLFRRLIAPLASLVGVALIAIVAFLCIYAWPAIKLNGFRFLLDNHWNLGNMYGNPITSNGQQIMPGAEYGILFLIAGTLLSTFIAVLIALPFGVGSAMFLAEGVPPLLRPWLSFFVELLAAVP